MRKTVRTLLAVVCAAALLTQATAQTPPGKATQDSSKKKAKDYSNSSIVTRMMAFNKKKDGKLTKAEVTDARLHRLFDMADTNKDGVVTKEELMALAAKLEEEYGSGGGFGGFMGGPGPFGGRGRRGPGGFGGPGQPGQILPAVLQERLKLTAKQKKQVAELQKDVDGKLSKILTEDQNKQLKALREGTGRRGRGGRGEFGGPGPGGPFGGRGGPGRGGRGGFGGPPQPGQILPSFLQERLKLSAKQKKQVAELQKDVDGKLAKILTEDQNKQLKLLREEGPGRGGPGRRGEPEGDGADGREGPGERGPGGVGGPPRPGQVLPTFLQDRLKLTAKQKKQLEELQKEVDGKLGKILTEDQKKQLKSLRQGPGRGGPPMPPDEEERPE
jgi:hypothetical protein